MMDRMYHSIKSGLKAVKDCRVYQEDVFQNFSTPSWLILPYDQHPAAGINGCINNRVRLDVAYFPKDDTEINAECWAIGQSLARDFRMEGFKIKNRSLKITDDVLHFMFDVDYREYLPDGTPQMQGMSQRTDMKEV